VAVVDDYAKRAAEKAVIDYGFHLIISDPTRHALDVELPGPIARGITSFKVYMTYDLFKLTSVGKNTVLLSINFTTPAANVSRQIAIPLIIRALFSVA
jgi:acyl dehydratase